MKHIVNTIQYIIVLLILYYCIIIAVYLKPTLSQMIVIIKLD